MSTTAMGSRPLNARIWDRDAEDRLDVPIEELARAAVARSDHQRPQALADDDENASAAA